jgi:hypothetical protein
MTICSSRPSVAGAHTNSTGFVIFSYLAGRFSDHTLNLRCIAGANLRLLLDNSYKERVRVARRKRNT